jgi:transposase-like protein
MEAKQQRQRCAFAAEYKADVVALCRTDSKAIGAVARDLGISENAVRR